MADLACEMLRRFEGLRLDAYPDPATGGEPITIGYGATNPGVFKLGLRWTQEQAESDLLARVQALVARVVAMLAVPLPDLSIAALVSFSYNVGPVALKSSTLLRKLNAGDTQGAAMEFDKWVKAAGRVLPALIERRQAEKEAFLAGIRQAAQVLA